MKERTGLRWVGAQHKLRFTHTHAHLNCNVVRVVAHNFTQLFDTTIGRKLFGVVTVFQSDQTAHATTTDEQFAQDDFHYMHTRQSLHNNSVQHLLYE